MCPASFLNLCAIRSVDKIALRNRWPPPSALRPAPVTSQGPPASESDAWTSSEATQAQVSAELSTSSDAHAAGHLGQLSDCHCPTSTAGQDVASAESQESLPTVMPNGPFLLTSTDSPALGQSQGPPQARSLQTPLRCSPPTPPSPAGCSAGAWNPAGLHLPEICWDTLLSRDWQWHLENTKRKGKRKASEMRAQQVRSQTRALPF